MAMPSQYEITHIVVKMYIWAGWIHQAPLWFPRTCSHIYSCSHPSSRVSAPIHLIPTPDISDGLWPIVAMWLWFSCLFYVSLETVDFWKLLFCPGILTTLERSHFLTKDFYPRSHHVSPYFSWWASSSTEDCFYPFSRAWRAASSPSFW